MPIERRGGCRRRRLLPRFHASIHSGTCTGWPGTFMPQAPAGFLYLLSGRFPVGRQSNHVRDVERVGKERKKEKKSTVQLSRYRTLDTGDSPLNSKRRSKVGTWVGISGIRRGKSPVVYSSFLTNYVLLLYIALIQVHTSQTKGNKKQIQKIYYYSLPSPPPLFFLDIRTALITARTGVSDRRTIKGPGYIIAGIFQVFLTTPGGERPGGC